MNLKKIIVFIILILGISLGISLTMKANIGVDAWDALSQSGSVILNIPVGTFMMYLNFSCIFIEFIILRSNFKLKHILQIVLSILIGYSVNFFYYDLLGNLIVDNYLMKLFLLILGYVMNAFVVAGIMLLDMVTFALEGACKVISDTYHLSFSKFRQLIDILSIVIVFVLYFIFDIELYVREGTIIGMLIFGPLIGLFMGLLKPIFIKYELI